MNLKLKFHTSSCLFVLCTGFLLLFLNSFQTNPEEKPGRNEIFSESIHSVKLYRERWEFSMPLLELGSSQRLILRFDDLSGKIKNYSYTITHCDFDWFPSRLTPSEFMTGFNENPLNNYRQSINTTVPYVHYVLSIPNEDVRLLVSGNYLLTVFEEGKRDKPVLSRKFYVLEPSAKISGIVKKAVFDSYKGVHQEVDFNVVYPGVNIQDPRMEVKTALLQNMQEDNAITGLKPSSIREGQLIYDYSKENVFLAGNEFRNFDATNLQTNGLGIESIDFVNPFFHINLLPAVPRNEAGYTMENDLNGRYLIKNARTSDPDLESDYLLVHFLLQVPEPLLNGDVFIFGELTGWKCQPAGKMTYNPKKKIYEGNLLLKQGFYDYQYVFKEKESSKIDHVLLEGSHVETENDYQILVYYHGFSSRYDRLIGFKTLNSVKQ
jgi:hypothetical protein